MVLMPSSREAQACSIHLASDFELIARSVGAEAPDPDAPSHGIEASGFSPTWHDVVRDVMHSPTNVAPSEC